MKRVCTFFLVLMPLTIKSSWLLALAAPSQVQDVVSFFQIVDARRNRSAPTPPVNGSPSVDKRRAFTFPMRRGGVVFPQTDLMAASPSSSVGSLNESEEPLLELFRVIGFESFYVDHLQFNPENKEDRLFLQRNLAKRIRKSNKDFHYQKKIYTRALSMIFTVVAKGVTSGQYQPVQANPFPHSDIIERPLSLVNESDIDDVWETIFSWEEINTQKAFEEAFFSLVSRLKVWLKAYGLRAKKPLHQRDFKQETEWPQHMLSVKAFYQGIDGRMEKSLLVRELLKMNEEKLIQFAGEIDEGLRYLLERVSDLSSYVTLKKCWPLVPREWESLNYQDSLQVEQEIGRQRALWKKMFKDILGDEDEVEYLSVIKPLQLANVNAAVQAFLTQFSA